VSGIIAALAKFHTEVGTIEKLSKAQYGQFADLATVLGAVNPVLASNGLALTQTFQLLDGVTFLVTTLRHAGSSETIESVCPLIETPAQGSRNNPLHLWGGAVTYQRRYCALSLLGLAAGIEDDDGDHASQTVRTSTPARKPAPNAPKVEPFETPEEAVTAMSRCFSNEDLDALKPRIAASKFRPEELSVIAAAGKARRDEIADNPMVDDDD